MKRTFKLFISFLIASMVLILAGVLMKLQHVEGSFDTILLALGSIFSACALVTLCVLLWKLVRKHQ